MKLRYGQRSATYKFRSLALQLIDRSTTLWMKGGKTFGPMWGFAGSKLSTLCPSVVWSWPTAIGWVAGQNRPPVQNVVHEIAGVMPLQSHKTPTLYLPWQQSWLNSIDNKLSKRNRFILRRYRKYDLSQSGQLRSKQVYQSSFTVQGFFHRYSGKNSLLGSKKSLTW